VDYSTEGATLQVSTKNSITSKMMQYCRALHAEENAILQTSVIGGMGVAGGIIYATVFPCELCAKKIYQANIRKVIYTEPYPRSISKDVFFQDGTRKIEFEQFEGVKSQSYFRLYKATIDKKEFQMLRTLGPKKN
jgi:dCMP deaminase